MTQFSASGGLLGGGSGQKEDDDSLISESSAKILFLVSEGPIYGFAKEDPLECVYVDSTPVKNANKTENFKDVGVDIRVGDPIQTAIPGFNEVENVVSVGVIIKKDLGPITRRITDSNVNATKVTLAIQNFQSQDKKGGIKGTRADYKIYVSTNNGPFVEKISSSFNGKRSGAFQRSHYIKLETGGPWDIRVERLTDDSTKQSVQNAFTWQSYSEITEGKFTYPNSCVIGIKINAEQFSSIPQFAFYLKGISSIKIPHNYDPVSRTYEGIFNGSLKNGYTNNPAWIYYDLRTNPIYGVGKYLGDPVYDGSIIIGYENFRISVADLYAIGQYCDQQVPDGKGGLEPRFVCNVYIRDFEDAFTLLNNLAATFRGMIYWESGTVRLVQDTPKEPVRYYAEANTKQEVDDSASVTTPCFNFSGTAKAARHTVAKTKWRDPLDLYKEKTAIYIDRDAVRRYGYNEIEIPNMGCTSESQALRLLRWYIYTETLETELLTTTTADEGMLCRPGEIIEVASTLKMGKRTAGRILEGSTPSLIKLDDEFEILAGVVYEIKIMNPMTEFVSRTISNAPGRYSEISVTSDFNFTPIHKSLWIIGSNNLKPRHYRVISVEENAGEYTITALENNPAKYDEIEKQLIVTPKAINPIRRTNIPSVDARTIIIQDIDPSSPNILDDDQ